MNKKTITSLVLSVFICPGMGQYWLGFKKHGLYIIAVVNVLILIWTVKALQLTQAKLGFTQWQLNQFSVVYFKTMTEVVSLSDNLALNISLNLLLGVWLLALIHNTILIKNLCTSNNTKTSN